MILLSQIIGARVLDAAGVRVGTVRDLIATGFDQFPRVLGFHLVRRSRHFAVAWSEVASYEVTSYSSSVRLQSAWRGVESFNVLPEHLLLRRDVMDHQIIDIRQYRVVRVNDVSLVPSNGTLLVAGVDASFRGLLRRLRLEGVADFIARLLRLTLHRTVIGWNQVEVMKTEHGGVIQLRDSIDKLKRLHPHDLAAIVNQMDPDERTEVFQSIDIEQAADALPEVEPEVQVSIIESLHDDHAAEIISEMEPDEAADLLGDLPHERTEDLLERMDKDEAEEIKELLRYADDTAGGIMTNDFEAVPVGLTASEVIEYLRQHGTIDHEMYYVYVVEEHEQLLGVFTLGALIAAPPDASVSSFMRPDPIRVRPDASMEEVAQVLARYDLLAVPVADNNERLLGIATIDDVIELVIPQKWKQQFPRVFGSATGSAVASAVSSGQTLGS